MSNIVTKELGKKKAEAGMDSIGKPIKILTNLLFFIITTHPNLLIK